MTITEAFADYIPVAWFDETGARIAGRLRQRSATAVKRMRRWKNTAKGASLTVVFSASLALGSLSTTTDASASNGRDVPLPPEIVQIAPPPAPDAALGVVNESFDQLFNAFRAGLPLINNERTRQLATKSASRRGTKPKNWARNLAKDVRDAND